MGKNEDDAGSIAIQRQKNTCFLNPDVQEAMMKEVEKLDNVLQVGGLFVILKTKSLILEKINGKMKFCGVFGRARNEEILRIDRI